MKIITNAIVYKATLPEAAALVEHLAEMPFHAIPENLIASNGFIPTAATGELVTPLAGGLCFTLRRDEKILPSKAVSAAIAAEVERVEAELSEEAGEPVKVEGDDYKALKERVRDELIAKALHTSTVTTCFYHADSRLLIVPVTNKKLAATIIGALVQACGAVETTTIHVSDVKGGLTTRLQRYFGDGETGAFEGFKLGDSVVMKGDMGKASFDLENLDHGKQGVLESLGKGLIAERLELVRNDAVSFRLTHQFDLRRIEFLGELSEEQAEEQEDWDFAYRWRHEAAVQMALLADVLQALCDLFGYQEPERTEPEGEPSDEGAAQAA
ncbi:MAG TPA: recombination-associated protein RdgC [Pseudomonas sp.]